MNEITRIIYGGFIDIIFGLMWGDEGKGKIIDYLQSKNNYAAVIRANGGSNAGHTIEVGGNKTVLHLLPSGIENKECLLICGAGMVIHPGELIKEIQDVLHCDPNIGKRLYISDQATITTIYDKIKDQLRELPKDDEKRNGANGSTQKGIAFSYASDAEHIALRYKDLYLSEKAFRIKYDAYAVYQEKIIEALYPLWLDSNPIEMNRLQSEWLRAVHIVRRQLNICDTVLLANQILNSGRNILIEGAQATFLDTRLGDYPNVTSSHTIPQMLLGYTGLPIQNVRDSIAVTKWYTTKVGDGTFPGRMDKATETLFREAGGEIGATTGRKRMCAWPNEMLYERALMLTHPTQIYINKLDVCPVDTIEVVIDHLRGTEISHGSLSSLAGITGVKTERMHGWNVPANTTDIKKLPKGLLDYLRRLKFITQTCSPRTKIAAIGTGPGREHIIQLD